MEESEFHSLRSDVASLKGDIAGIRATATAQAGHNTRVDAWLQNISKEVRESLHKPSVAAPVAPLQGKNNLTVVLGIITALITGSAVLISLGTSALNPVRENVADLQSEVREARKHEDGHPQYISDRVDAAEKLHLRDRKEHREAGLLMATKLDKLTIDVAVLNAILLTENKVEKLAISSAVLETIAKERTRLFVRTQELRDDIQEKIASDRHTGSEQEAYAAGKDAEQKAYASGVEQRLRTLEEGRLKGLGSGHRGRDDE